MRRLITVIAISVGCAGNGASSLAPIDQLCDATRGVYTRWLLDQWACFGAAASTSLPTPAYQERNCHAYVEPLVAAGVVQIADESVIAELRDALAANHCSADLYKDWVKATSAYNRLLVGQKAVGAACSSPPECVPGAYCRIVSGTPCGTCASLVANGGTCDDSSACASGVCLQGTCRASGLAAGASCDVPEQCDAGLICQQLRCASAANSIGQPCQSFSDCPAYTESCVNGRCAADAVLGQPCALRYGGASSSLPGCNWVAGAGCLSGTCASLPVAGANMACGPDVAECDASTWCVTAQVGAICKPIVAEGSTCFSDSDCGPFAECRAQACTFSDYDATCQ